MTDPHGAHGASHGGVRSEEDRVSTPAILAVGVGSLRWDDKTTVFKQGEHGPIPIPPEVGQSKIGLVEQQDFDLSVRGERDREARRERLGSFGWVDRSTGVAHVPIDLAMDLVAKGVRPAPAPAQREREVPGGQP